jgi:hypothetical protein
MSPITYAQISIDSGAEVPLIQESDLDQTVKFGLCVVLFVNTDLHDRNDQNMKSMYGTTLLQFTDQLMREIMVFKERIASSVKVYKVNWKLWSSDPGSQIRFAAGPFPLDPKNPVFVTYDVNGTVATRINGPMRPDALTWLVHGVMEYYIHSLKTGKGEFLRVGWLITDTNLPFINLVNVRKEDFKFNGRTEQVQINTYVSTPYEGESYQFERMYAQDGRLLGSVESYGPHGKFGYFDYDRTGKFQYRVRYSSGDGK